MEDATCYICEATVQSQVEVKIQEAGVSPGNYTVKINCWCCGEPLEFDVSVKLQITTCQRAQQPNNAN